MGKDYRYDYQNQKNATKNGAGYQLAPSAPTVEINIKTTSGADSPVRSSASPARYIAAPRHPPPPPPLASAPPLQTSIYSTPEYSHPFWFERFVRRENRGMFRLALVEALLATVLLAGGWWCARDTPSYCPYYAGLWTGAFFMLNALVGIAAAKIGAVNLYLGHLALSLIAFTICIVGAIISARHWFLVGTYHHPRVERDDAFCLLGQHDAPRISYIFSHMDKYDFKGCLYQLKVGIAVNSVQFVVCVIEALLLLLSAWLCCKRTCTSCI